MKSDISYLAQTSDIACFTKSGLKDSIKDSAIEISNYSIIRRDRPHAQHSGVCLYIDDTIRFSILNEYSDPSNIEVLWCRLRPNRLPGGFSGLAVCM